MAIPFDPIINPAQMGEDTLWTAPGLALTHLLTHTTGVPMGPLWRRQDSSGAGVGCTYAITHTPNYPIPRNRYPPPYLVSFLQLTLARRFRCLLSLREYVRTVDSARPVNGAICALVVPIDATGVQQKAEAV